MVSRGEVAIRIPSDVHAELVREQARLLGEGRRVSLWDILVVWLAAPEPERTP